MSGIKVSLDGKVALVTGASKGIGAAVAQAFATAGAAVMISSRKLDALTNTAEAIGGSTAVFAANAGDPNSAEACVRATLEQFGRIDILVNNAATSPYFGPTIDIDLPRFNKIIDVNLRGPLVYAQYCWHQWMKDHGGSIINMASVGGVSHTGHLGVYDTSKAALIHLTKMLAIELGPRVRVNAIAPGLIKTDFARAVWEPAGDDAEYGWPLRRIGVPEDVANAAVYLASELASWVTGEVLSVDGGYLLSTQTDA